MEKVEIILLISPVLAFAVESLTEYIFGTAVNRFPKLEPYRWLLMYVALIFGLVVSFHYKLDLIATLINSLGGAHPAEAHGMLISGLAIGRGAEFVHKLISLFPKRSVK